MSMIALVMRNANASRADVLRVAHHGGSRAGDWGIAAAIEAVTGRPAAHTMWGPTHVPGTETAPPLANPHAVHDPEVRIYPENTSPEDANRVVPHHPHDEEPAETCDDTDIDAAVEEQQLREAADDLAAAVYSDLAAVLDDAAAAASLTAAWSTPAEGRALIRWVLDLSPRTRHRARARALAAS